MSNCLNFDSKKSPQTLLVKAIVTGFFTGLSPKAPGTIGSIAATVFWFLASNLSLIPSTTVAVIISLATCVIGTLLTHLYMKDRIDTKDPQEVVIDEWAGIFITYTIAGIYFPGHSIVNFFLGFVIFRIFDIIKPPPVKNFEQLPGALGVMADDIIAGVIAGMTTLVILQFTL